MRRIARLRPMIGILLIVAVMASSCSSLQPESLAFSEFEERPGRTVLRIATYTSDGLIDAVEQWEREHPTAEVLIERRDIDDHHSLILEPQAASTPTPDIVMYDSEYSALFRNETERFADLRAFGGDEFEAGSLGWRWSQGVADDETLVAIPIDVGGLALAYRTDLIGQFRSEQLEELSQWCELIVLGDRYSDRTRNAFLPAADDLFEAILNQSPIRFHNRDGRLIHATNPAVREAWDYTMRALGQRPQFEDPCPKDEDILRISANIPVRSDEWGDALRAGEFAAVLAPASMLDVIQATAPATSESWRLVSIPGGGGGNSGGAQLAVSAGSQHQELAYNLVAHLAEPTTQLRVFHEVGNFPAAESLYDDLQLVNFTSDFFGDSAIGQIYIDSVSAFAAAPDGPEHELILDEFRRAVTRVESGSQTPEQSWNEALWRIELLLE